MNAEVTKLDDTKKEIQVLGLNAIQEYFKLDVSKLDANTLRHIHQKAKIGLQFEKEMNLNHRAVEMNYVRVFKMVAEDKHELRKLIKKAVPKYLAE